MLSPFPVLWSALIAVTPFPGSRQHVRNELGSAWQCAECPEEQAKGKRMCPVKSVEIQPL